MLGMSATPPNVLMEAHGVSERRGLARVRGEQCLYSAMARGVEEFVLPTCQQLGIGVLTYAPLNGGWLSGKYQRAAVPPPGSRAASLLGRTGRWDEARPEVARKHDVVDALSALAAEAGLSLTHLATAFAAEHPAVSSVIIGPRMLRSRISSPLGAALTADVLDRIDAIVPPGRTRSPGHRGRKSWPDDPARRRRRDALHHASASSLE
jgi:aryl-alcohol dehydrogenase-like predicted oxidoreductase